MNSDPNSYSKQCPESKTGLGAQGAHPKDPGCARTSPRPCAQHRVVVHRAPCHGRVVVVSQAMLQRCCLCPPVTIQKFVSQLNPYRPHCMSCNARLSQRSCAVSQGAVAPYHSPWHAVSRHQACPSYHETTICIATHLSSQALCARVAACLCTRANRVVGRAGRIMAVVPLLCHDTICCIVTKTGKWAVSHPVACICFSLFFSFPLFQLL